MQLRLRRENLRIQGAFGRKARAFFGGAPGRADLLRQLRYETLSPQDYQTRREHLGSCPRCQAAAALASAGPPRQGAAGPWPSISSSGSSDQASAIPVTTAAPPHAALQRPHGQASVPSPAQGQVSSAPPSASSSSRQPPEARRSRTSSQSASGSVSSARGHTSRPSPSSHAA